MFLERRPTLCGQRTEGTRGSRSAWGKDEKAKGGWMRMVAGLDGAVGRWRSGVHWSLCGRWRWQVCFLLAFGAEGVCYGDPDIGSFVVSCARFVAGMRIHRWRGEVRGCAEESGDGDGAERRRMAEMR